MLRRIILLIVCCSIFQATKASVRNDFGMWTPVLIKVPLNEKIVFIQEINPRIQEDMTRFNQLLIRPWLGYKINDRWSIWTGYAWITNYVPDYVSEQRLWQQVMYEKKFGKLKTTNRFRVEERFLRGDVFGMRFRHMIRAEYPLNKKETWYAVTYDELFVNPTSYNGLEGVDQNRLFVGLKHKFSNNIAAELGYLQQYMNQAEGTPNRINHNIGLTFNFELPQLFN